MSSISISPGTGLLHLPLPFPLEKGGELRGAHLAYELFGPEEAPLVVVQGGISAGRQVTRGPYDRSAGWWEDFVGEGCPIDTQRYRVLGLDYLGGAGASTGPANWGSKNPFPAVTSQDQARATALLFDHLRVRQAHVFVGSSYGGMVALAMAVEFPNRLGHIVSISGAHDSHPMATAWRSLQRRIVELGIARGATAEAVALARGLAMTTYRSHREFRERFGSEPEERGGQFHFPVEGYLRARGEDFANRFPPETFLCLSQAIDLHRIDPAAVAVPTTLVGVTSDQLVPLSQMRELAEGVTAPCNLVELESIFGHDAFLKEVEALRPILVRALEGPS